MTVLISRYAFSSAGHGASLQSLCASDGLAGPLAAWPGFGPTADGGSGPPQRWPRAERPRSVSSARRSRPLLPASLLPAASGLVPENWAPNPPGSVPWGATHERCDLGRVPTVSCEILIAKRGIGGRCSSPSLGPPCKDDVRNGARCRFRRDGLRC